MDEPAEVEEPELTAGAEALKNHINELTHYRDGWLEEAERLRVKSDNAFASAQLMTKNIEALEEAKMHLIRLQL